MWFSDEAHFTLYGYVNKQNVLFWGTQKTEAQNEESMNGKKVTIKAALSRKDIIGPYFFQERDRL